MGKTKRLQATPSIKQASQQIQTKAPHRRKSLFSLISTNDVTEGSLKIWRALPSIIRHDPSLVSFQLEHNRLHGDELDGDDQENVTEMNGECSTARNQPEFIHINVTNEFGIDQNIENIW